MTIASELLWQLAPPLVFATDRPRGRGDAGAVLRQRRRRAWTTPSTTACCTSASSTPWATGSPRPGVAAFALSAYRHSRRRGCGLAGDLRRDGRRGRRAVPRRALRHGRHRRSSTSRAGRLAWISAGHPPPLVIRDGRLARTLTAPPAAPLGIPLRAAAAGRGRRVVGARRPAAALHRRTDRGAPPRRAAVHRRGARRVHRARGRRRRRPLPRRCAGCATPSSTASPGQLDDDATAVLVEWRRGAEADLLPQTAP